MINETGQVGEDRTACMPGPRWGCSTTLYFYTPRYALPKGTIKVSGSPLWNLVQNEDWFRFPRNSRKLATQGN